MKLISELNFLNLVLAMAAVAIHNYTRLLVTLMKNEKQSTNFKLSFKK